MRRLSIASCAFALAPWPARAGNDDAVLLGNEGAMTGGAVVAVTADCSAIVAGRLGPRGVHSPRCLIGAMSRTQ